MSEELSVTPLEEKGPPRRVILGKRSEEFIVPFPFPRIFLWKPKINKDNADENFLPPPPFRIVITQDVLERVNKHVTEDQKIEIGGFLLGDRYRCATSDLPYVMIDNYSEAQFCAADDISMNITDESWVQLQEELTGKNRGKKAIGWYHSHPNLGVYLSNHDVDVHRNRFTEDWNVALVIDPVARNGGFFCRRNGELYPREFTEFYEIRGVNQKETFMPWQATYDCYEYKKEQISQVKPKLVESMKMYAPESEPDPGESEPPPPPRRPLSKLVMVASVVVFCVIGLATFQAVVGPVLPFGPDPSPTQTPPNRKESSPTPIQKQSPLPDQPDQQRILTNIAKCQNNSECKATLTLLREPARDMQVVLGEELIPNKKIKRISLKQISLDLSELQVIKDFRRNGGTFNSELQLKESNQSVAISPVSLTLVAAPVADRTSTHPPSGGKTRKKKKGNEPYQQPD